MATKPHHTPHFSPGQRVKTLPHTDAFMQGARYGTVVCISDRTTVVVRMEVSAVPLKQLRQFHPSSIAPLEV